MEIELDGVGALGHASVSIDGISVILGRNNSGKSTVLKSLYCVGDAPSGFMSKKTDEILGSVSTLINSRRYLSQTDRRELFGTIRAQLGSGDPESAISTMRTYLSPNGTLDPDAPSVFDTIRSLTGSDDDSEFMDVLSERSIESEFTRVRQARDISVNRPARMTIRDGGTEFGISIDADDRCTWFGDIRDHFSSVIYYDTPFLLDDYQPGAYPFSRSDHRGSLISRLAPRDIGVAGTMDARKDAARFYGLMRSVIEGDFETGMGGLRYVSKNNPGLNMSNVAAGTKVFAILRMLADNGCLRQGSLLLLDEPESHLHPEWLDVLAKTIVFLARDMDVRVVMTTHSPLLLLSIQAHALEYGQHADYYSIIRDGEGPASVDDLRGDLTGVYDSMTRSFLEANQLYRRLTGDGDDGGQRLGSRRRALPGNRLLVVGFAERSPKQRRKCEADLP